MKNFANGVSATLEQNYGMPKKNQESSLHEINGTKVQCEFQFNSESKDCLLRRGRDLEFSSKFNLTFRHEEKGEGNEFEFSSSSRSFRSTFLFASQVTAQVLSK